MLLTPPRGSNKSFPEKTARIATFNPKHALGFTGIGLLVENMLISLRRLHSLAFGFETFAFWQKTELSRLSTVFQGNPIPVLMKYLSLSSRQNNTIILQKRIR
jgi:hypothetical protein